MSDVVVGMSEEMLAVVTAVRTFMRDHPELNRLTRGEESSNRMIAFAVNDALSLYNLTPPVTRKTLRQLLDDQQAHLLIRLTVCTLIESVSLLMARNHLNYSAGGLNVGMNDKAPLLMNFLQYFKASTDQLLLRVKVAENINALLDPNRPGVVSEYWVTNSNFLQF